MPISILALGDSYTIGEGVPFYQNYPSQLASTIFQKENQEVQLEVIAKTGWTTQDLLNELQENQTRKSTYSFVFLLIGVNNQYQTKSLEEYKAHLDGLAKFCSEKASYNSKNIFWISIPDYSVTPFAMEMDKAKIASELTIYNQVFSEYAGKYQFQMVNITDISRNLNNDTQMLAEDQLHPSGKMYRAWVDRILPLIKPHIS